MGDEWVPEAGSVVLIEPDAPGPPITAVAVADPAGRVLLDVGASPTPGHERFGAIASVFGPDRMYRVKGVLSPRGSDRGTVYELEAESVERIERRTARRGSVEVPACLTAFDGPGAVVSTLGHTVDLSSGGCRVVTEEPFPVGSEPTVSLRLDDGTTVLARAAILERRRVPEGFHYRLMFTDIDLEDRIRVAALVVA